MTVISAQSVKPLRVKLTREDYIERWFDCILIECPKCSLKATNHTVNDMLHDRRVSCINCGYSKNSKCDGYRYGNSRDPFLGSPLWLKTNTSKGELFAFNQQHLNELQSFVSATLRERSQDKFGWENRNYFSRLPSWIKSGANRDMILNALEKMANKK